MEMSISQLDLLASHMLGYPLIGGLPDGRYLQYILQSRMQAFRLNFNFLFHRCSWILPVPHARGKSTRIDLFDQFNSHEGIVKRICNSRFLLGGALVRVAERALRGLGLDASKPTVIHCHDPILLPLAVNLAKAHRNWRVIYDRHELYEDSHNDSGVNLATALERVSKRQISGVVVVSDDHIKATRRRFPDAEVVCVPNYPSIKDYDEGIIERKIRSLDNDTQVVISYIGSLDNCFDRDIDLMLKIGEHAAASGRARFLIGGRVMDVNIEKKLQDLAQKFPDSFQLSGICAAKEDDRINSSLSHRSLSYEA